MGHLEQGAAASGGGGGGGALTVQSNALGVDTTIGVAGADLFTDTFAVGTWDISYSLCLAPQAVEQVAMTVAARTATATFKGPSELDVFTQSTGATTSFSAKFCIVVTVAGTVALRADVQTSAATAKADRTGYYAVKVA